MANSDLQAKSNLLKDRFEQERKKFKFLARRSTMIILFIIFGLIFLQIFLPFAAESAIRRSLGEALAAESISADLKAVPVFKIFAGNADSLDITITTNQNSLLNLTKLEAVWMQNNVLDYLRNGQLMSTEAQPTYLSLYWTEATLVKYLNSLQSQILISGITIGEQSLDIIGRIDLVGKQQTILLNCKPQITDQQIQLKLNSWQMEELIMTDQLENRLNEALTFKPSLAPLAWDLNLEQVIIDQQQLIIYALENRENL